MTQPRRSHFGCLTHALVALVAMAAGYFYLFYGHSYLFPPSVPSSAKCSPGAVTFLATNGTGERIRLIESHCALPWHDIGISLQDADGQVSAPFLVLEAEQPVVHGTWTSPDDISVEITGTDISVKYARDRFHGIRMHYTLHG